jgi:hypothetical protein
MPAIPAVRVVAFIAIAWSLGQLPRDRAPAPEAAGTSVLTGRVLIDINSSAQPVRRARLVLESDVLSAARTTDTDTDGRYQFARLPAGSYRVRAEKAGFVAVVRDARRTFERPAPIEIAANQKAALDVWMTRGAALEGRVTIDTGAPGIDIVVSALRFAYDENGRRPVPVAQARTDDRGRFRVHSLPPGEYYLEAAPDPLRVLNQISVPGRRPTMLTRSYFPSAPVIEAGRTLLLAPAQEVGGIDFTLSTIPAAVVSGRIVASTGTPEVSLPRLQRVGGPVGEVRGAGMPTGGDFQYPSVPRGEYWLMGAARPAPGADIEFGVLRISVAGQDMTNISIPTAKGALVNGRIEVDGDGTIALDRLEVIAHQTEFELPGVTGVPIDWSAPVGVAADGSFSLKDVFGPRLLRVARLPAGWALKQALLDGAETTDASFDFKGGTRPHELRLVITSRTNRVTGIVRDGAGRPVGDARVVAFSTDEQTWKFRSRMIKAAETGADGRYVIEGLLDGRYHIVAVPFLEQGSWMDASVLRRLESGAAPLQAANAARLTLDLVVKP